MSAVRILMRSMRCERRVRLLDDHLVFPALTQQNWRLPLTLLFSSYIQEIYFYTQSIFILLIQSL